MSTQKIPSITILLPGGRLQLDAMDHVRRVAEEFSLGIYLTTLQNLRLTDIRQQNLGTIQQRLRKLGLVLQEPGRFPLPRVCVGKNHCNLGIVDTLAMSETITSFFGDKDKTKAKFRIAVSGCDMCCSGTKTTDMGIIATREGFDFYVGGKGGPHPKVGTRVGTELNEEQVLEMMAKLVDFHDEKTQTRQRFAKLMEQDDFPYSEV